MLWNKLVQIFALAKTALTRRVVDSIPLKVCCGIRMMSAAGPLSCKVGPPWIGLSSGKRSQPPGNPSARCCLGNTHPAIQVMWKKTWFIKPDQLLPLFHDPVLNRCQHGHSECSVAMQPHAQQTATDCAFWHLSIRISINLFGNVSYSSSSVGSDHTGQPLLTMQIN